MVLLQREITTPNKLLLLNKKHLKNVGPIHYCEPPHAHSPGVASGTVARRLPIDVHDANDNDRQRQRVTEGTAMAPWNGPNHGPTLIPAFPNFATRHLHHKTETC